MNRIRQTMSVALVLAMVSLGLTAAQAQTRPYRINDRQVDNVLRRVENSADRFRASFSLALDRSRYNGTSTEDQLNGYVQNFENATDALRDRFNRRVSVAADVENVLNQAAFLNDFIMRNRLDMRAMNDWTTLRADLSQLASAYSVAWHWDVRQLPAYGTDTTAEGVFDNDTNNRRGVRAATRLTGTFRLDPTQSDNAMNVAEMAVRNLPFGERARVREQIMRRLEAPEMLAIERNGNNVTIASSRAPQTTFVANSGETREQLPNGSFARVSSTIQGDRLIVRSAGNRETDFTVTFDPIEAGRRLRVTREIWNERLGVNPIIVQNVYERTADVAQWNVYTGTTAGYGQTSSQPGVVSSAAGDFIVPDGQMLTARLETDLSTRTAQTGDRFTMTVTSPSQFQGAVIEGHVASASRSGRITGRSDLSLNFDTIRYNGRTYQFAGFIDTVRAMNGEMVRVDNEGTVRDDDSRGSETAQRAAIGTAVGAIIGAIAGGGKGAAIGAVIGAGAGAGSVYVQGREDLELLSGSEITIRASAPSNR